MDWQHYISQFYQKQFLAPGKDKLYVYFKEDGPIGVEHPTKAPKNIFAEHDYFTLYPGTDKADASIDKVIVNEMEKAAPYIKRLGEDPLYVPTEDEALRIAGLMALYYLGNPRQIRKLTEVHKALAFDLLKSMGESQNVMDQMERRHQRLVAQGKADDVADFRGDMGKILSDPESALSIAVERESPLVRGVVANLEKITLLLYNREWVICTAREGTAFITSDNPVSCIIPERDGTIIGVGPGVPRSVVLFPVSPRRLIMLRHGPVSCRLRDIDREQVKRINLDIAANADTMVLSTYRSEDIKSMVAKLRVTRQQPLMDPRWIEAMKKRRGLDRIFNLNDLDLSDMPD